MKAELINFELWFSYDTEHDQEKVDRLTVELALADIKKAIEEKNIDCVVGLLLVDGFLYKDHEGFYTVLKEIYNRATALGIKKFYLMPGICSNYQKELDKRNLQYEIIDWDFSVGQIYQSYKDRLTEVNNWNPDANKFLFLGGVPSRPNRIGLLSKYYDLKLLDRANWSFFPPWIEDDKIWCRDHLSHYTDIEYDNFLKHCDSAVDEKYSVSKDYSRVSGKEFADKKLLDSPWLTDCAWIDPAVFSNTSLSIISEGSCYPPAKDFKFLTEKLWRAVINNHPFIVADHPERFSFMKDIGLRTFEDYLLIPDYAFIKDENQRLDAVVENTVYFLDNIFKNIDQINNDVIHNKKILFNIVENNTQTINWLMSTLLVDKSSIDTWLTVKDFKPFIRIPQ